MTTDHLTTTSGRCPFLTALDEAVRKRGGMSCGIVARSGTPVLYVVNTEAPGKFTEIGADFIAGTWMFTWAPTGETIGAANSPTHRRDDRPRARGSPRDPSVMGSEFATIARLLLIFGTLCLLFGATAGYVLGSGLVHRTRRLLRRLRR